MHAFNVLRFVFADKELTTETVGFAAKGLTAAIKGFSSPHWEVRFFSVDFRDFFAEVIVTHACASLSRAVCASATARARHALDVFRNVQAGARASRAGTRARNRARRRGAIRTFSNVFFFFAPPRECAKPRGLTAASRNKTHHVASSAVRRSFRSQVRNGATLAYAALLTKVVGYMNVANPKAGGASRRAVAGDDFFRRFPTTHPFLLAKLVEAADALESTKKENDGAGAVHPALYPILALLSRLRPAAGAPARGREAGEDDVDENDSTVAGDLDPAAFAPAVRRCARGRVHAVRAAAARALAPLIKAEDVARALTETFRDAAAFDDDDLGKSLTKTRSATRRPMRGYNAAHGALLCASELMALEGPAEAGTTAHAMAAVEAAAEGLARCSYLADPEASPVAAAAAAWALCAHETLRVARATRDRLAPTFDAETETERKQHALLVRRFWRASRRLTRLAKASCDVPSSALGFVTFSGGGDAARRAADRGVSVAPGDVEWFKRAARLSCVAALDTEGFHGRLPDAYGFVSDDESDASDEDEEKNLRDRDVDRDCALRAFLSALGPSLPYESRASALRALRDAGKERVVAALGTERFRRLKTFVAKTLLPTEKRHACRRRALEALEQWTASDVFRDEDADTDVFEDDDLSPETWRVVLRLASAETNERVRCAATVLLGKLVGARLRRVFFRRDVDEETTDVRANSHAARDSAADVDASSAERCVSSLVALVKAGSAPARPLDVRRAVARALANSEILAAFPAAEASDETLLPTNAQALSPLCASCLVAWTAAFELMEDEDEQTRDVVAVACASAARGDPNAHTEATLRVSFDVVARRFRNTAQFQNLVASLISGGFWDDEEKDGVFEDGHGSVTSSSSHTSRHTTHSSGLSKPLIDAVNETKIVRRLFDREADNHHAEGLLLAQLAARAVAEAPCGQTVTKPFAEKRLLNAARFVAVAARTLEAETQTFVKDSAKDGFFPGWAGGATNHGAPFAIVNRACLALWAYACAASDEARTEARAVLVTERVAEAFEAARLGPAANAAWRAAEAAVVAAKKTSENAEDAPRKATSETPFVVGAFETYDPCFLLR